MRSEVYYSMVGTTKLLSVKGQLVNASGFVELLVFVGPSQHPIVAESSCRQMCRQMWLHSDHYVYTELYISDNTYMLGNLAL